MADTLQVAFYKGRTRFFNRLVSWWLNGPYSHAELILDTDAGGYAACASSSFLDGGVRLKYMRLDPEHWDLVSVSGSASAAWAWLEQYEGAGYDYLGLLGFIARAIGHNKSRFICSEAVAEMLGMSDGWRFDPCSLYAVVSYMCKYTDDKEG